MKLIMEYKEEDTIGKHVFEIAPNSSSFEGKKIVKIQFTLNDDRHHIWTRTIENWIDPLQEQPADSNRKVKDNYNIFHNKKRITLYPNKPYILKGKRLSSEEWFAKQR